MKGKFYLGLLVLFRLGYSQECPERLVVDQSNNPISNVHIYSANDASNGTLSDPSGSFTFCPNVNFVVSHIGYQSRLIDSKSSITTIILKPQLSLLEEVQVVSISARQTMHRVLDSLESNYYLSNEGYRVYVRDIIHQNSTEVDLMSEYLIDTWINENSRQSFKPQKVGAKSFTEKGSYYYKDMRMISGISASFQHLLSYRPEFLNRRKLEKSQIYFDESTGDDINIRIIMDDGERELLLVIDPESFAIKSLISIKPKFNSISSVVFVQVEDKWYLSHSKREGSKYGYDKSHKYFARYETVATFQRYPDMEYSKKDFKGYVNIVAEPIKAYNKDWNDPAWNEYRQELPAHINQIISVE